MLKVIKGSSIEEQMESIDNLLYSQQIRRGDTISVPSIPVYIYGYIERCTKQRDVLCAYMAIDDIQISSASLFIGEHTGKVQLVIIMDEKGEKIERTIEAKKGLNLIEKIVDIHKNSKLQLCVTYAGDVAPGDIWVSIKGVIK